MQGIGLIDKLYWRMADDGRWHCFKKTVILDGEHVVERCFESLCGRYKRTRAGGGQLLRPAVSLRCGICDGLEIKRRGKTESLPPSCEEI